MRLLLLILQVTAPKEPSEQQLLDSGKPLKPKLLTVLKNENQVLKPE